MSLAKAGMLVKLTRNSWYGFSKDKAASEAAKAAAGATAADAGNFNKRLLPKEALKPVRNVENKIYTKHSDLTVPWYFNGVDFLPSKLFLFYTEAMRALKDEHTASVAVLVQQYPVYRANRAKELGTMFNVNDYPPVDVFRSSFNIDIKFMPVPEAGDFRIDLENEEIAKLQANLKADLTDAQRQAMHSVWTRIVTVLDHVYERLSDPERVFRDSLIDNALQLSELLSGLNITGDPRMEVVAKGISSDICKHSSDVLRTDPDIRMAVATTAQTLRQACIDAMKE
jgi:hypothetical protein